MSESSVEYDVIVGYVDLFLKPSTTNSSSRPGMRRIFGDIIPRCRALATVPEWLWKAVCAVLTPSPGKGVNSSLVRDAFGSGVCTVGILLSQHCCHVMNRTLPKQTVL